MKKAKKWMKFRHKVITEIARLVLTPYVKISYNIKVEKFREQGDRQYLVLMNHQTGADQFFIGMAFKGPVYYVASEDLFSNGFVSTLLKYAVAPIPIKKQTTDVHAVMNCIKVAKEGGTIAIAPEGNRTYAGRPVHINPAIVPLIKKLGLPLALFRIEGGYGVQPRWSDVTRKGKMRAYVSRVIEPEEYASLSNDELLGLVKEELNVCEDHVDGVFEHQKNAEFLERVMYVCPYCGLSTFESHDDIIECKKCDRKIQHLPTKELKGVGFDFPFKFVADWYDCQCEFVNSLDVNEYIDKPMYVDTAALFEVILYKKKNIVFESADVSLFTDRMIVGDMLIPFEKITGMTVLGRNKLNIYFDGKLYQLKSHKRFNALKYVNIFYRYKNTVKGNDNVKFLGL